MLHHVWDSRAALNEQSLQHPGSSSEQSEAGSDVMIPDGNSTGEAQQGNAAACMASCSGVGLLDYWVCCCADEDGEVLLGTHGYKVFFGGVYSIENYRAM